MHEKFQMSVMGELTLFLGLQVLQKKDGIFLSQDKYVVDILKKFGYSDVRSMIGSLMYLTASRPDIMFAVCACARHQVTPKECHLHAAKRIFRYLKGHPKLGLWYPKDSPFNLVAYSDSDRKSTTGGCQFLGRRLILWQCKKQTIVATSITKADYVEAASGYGQVLWIQNQTLDHGNFIMAKLAFCDYHNMISILEKIEHNIDFHQIVDFHEASHTRIETTNQGTKILRTVDGKLWTIFESSLRRHLKLNDEEGISSLPDTELFENLLLMGYNILPNQRFTFQKGQFSHQWKFLIHTIMQCLSPKSIGFNEFSSNIATAVGEGLAIPTKPHHTPSPQEQHSPHHDPTSPSHPTETTEPIPQTPTETPTETPTLMRYTRRAIRIAQPKALSPAADEHASLLSDDKQRDAFPTVSSLDAGQDRENITKTSTLPYESSPRVTSLDADEGSMQQKLQELMDLCTILQRQQTQMAAKIKDQDLEISGLKTRVKFLEDKDRGSAEPTQEDAPIKGGIMETREEVGADKSTELGSNDTDEMVNVLSLMEAANILTSRVTAISVSPVADVSTVGVPTVSGLFPTTSTIFTTASVVTPYTRRPRGITIREEELKMMIKGLDRSNEVIAKHLQEYEQAEAELTVGEKIELINELVKYQDHHAKILKYQDRGMTLEEIKEKFIPVWKQLEDFMPMSSKKEGESVKRKGLKLDQRSAKRMKTFKDVSEEDHKGMMQLVPLEEVIRQATKDKEKELWVELKRLFEPNFKDQLWNHNQAFIHDPLEWKLYDTCGVHHVFTKGSGDIHAEFGLLDEDNIYSQSKTYMSVFDEYLSKNSPQRRASIFRNVEPERMKMIWRINENEFDSGVFLIYTWIIILVNLKVNGNMGSARNLRSRLSNLNFSARIILSKKNSYKVEFQKKVDKVRSIDKNTRRELIKKAVLRRPAKLDEYFGIMKS
nr:hypothetical protein [Tanacetum cinerariifolium]